MSARAVDARDRQRAPSLPPPAAGNASTVDRADVARALGLLAALALAVAARWAAIGSGAADPIVIGLGFGAALAAIAVVGRSGAGGLPSLARASARPSPRQLGRTAMIGLAGGAGLVALALVGRTIAGAPVLPPPLRGDLLAPWALATIVVATGEEAVLRGVVFDRLWRGAGLWPAILVTSLAFAVMHVPFYGWRVVPLDLGVGIWFAGLRLWSGGIGAPSIAHVLADLATWWL